MNKKAIVAMSGGLDSSVVALLLKQQGYDVIGVTGKMLDTPCAQEVCNNAKAVADKLGIEHHTIDMSEVFQKEVVEYFENSYSAGKTPNPCIQCNKFIKWGLLFDIAMQRFNADIFSTGHYAQIKFVDGVAKLYPAKDTKKDQLYFLYRLPQEVLRKTIFPLFDYEKEQVRELAYKYDLPSKSAKESQDICFIKYPITTKKYLNNLFTSKEGNFVEKSTGKVLGKHEGFWQYTIGQRKGIGIAYPEPLYVIGIDSEKNVVYVDKQQELYSKFLKLKNIDFSYKENDFEFEALVKIRYNMQFVKAFVKKVGDEWIVEFREPVSAITKGQACVFYDIYDRHLIGGSFI